MQFYQLIIRNVITEVAYNVQSTVDEKHNIPINYEGSNENDSKAKNGKQLWSTHSEPSKDSGVLIISSQKSSKNELLLMLD